MHGNVRSVYCTNEVTTCHGTSLWDVMINAYSVPKTEDMQMRGATRYKPAVADSDMSASPNIAFVERSLNVALRYSASVTLSASSLLRLSSIVVTYCHIESEDGISHKSQSQARSLY